MSEKLKVPGEWCCVNHIDIAEINPKFDIDQFKEDVEVSFLPMASVEKISGDYDLSQSRKLSVVKKGYTHFKNGDIIFAKITPCMENGKIAVLDNLLNGIGFGSTEFHVSRPHHDINTQFLFYYFVQSAFRNKAQRTMTGSAGQLRVSTEYFKNVNIPLPPLSEQRAIVSKIEQLFSDLDNGIENFKKAQEQLKRYRQSILKAACEGKLVPTEAELAHAEGRDYEPADVLLARILKERREKWNGKGKYKESMAPDTTELPVLPEGWRWTNMESTGEVSGGLTKNSKRNKLFQQMPYIRVSNVYADKLKLEDIANIGIKEKEIGRVLLEKGDLLVVEGNGSLDQIGRVALWDGSISPCVHQNHIIKVRFNPAKIGKFILLWLLSKKGRKQITNVASSTSGLYTLSISKVASLFIPLPPLTEQRRIVVEVERRLSLCDKMETTIAESLEKAEALRQSILKKAFEGKLLSEKELEEVRNAPDWEPAEKLLERIKAEKTNIVKNKGKK